VTNLREIAPLGFLGVPRIWEKMQHSVMFRAKDTTPIQRRVFEKCFALGRPIAERRLAIGGLITCLLWILWAEVSRLNL